ncbi:hypothetical protein HII31_01231 [Pseudocercospora fuligena]|uniref:Uncharacterized protein n=1 Tax=Pseudocercospora fuligena TaxID=685502 RepID=A0A8H6RWD0_9PEZI|nr:hypothetical protein HII31_01231 [Pseudocercospora fuligena]
MHGTSRQWRQVKELLKSARRQYSHFKDDHSPDLSKVLNHAFSVLGLLLLDTDPALDPAPALHQDLSPNLQPLVRQSTQYQLPIYRQKKITDDKMYGIKPKWKGAIGRSTNSKFSKALKALKKSDDEVQVHRDVQETPQTPIFNPKGTLSTHASDDKENDAPASSSESPLEEDDGFVYPKKHQQKINELKRQEAIVEAFKIQAEQNVRHMQDNWCDVKERTHAAKATIEKEENRLLRVQAHRNNSERNRVPEYSTVIGNWGTKSKPQEPVKTKNHGVLFSDQTPGLIVCHTDTFPLPKNSTKKVGDKGVWVDRHGVVQEDKPRYHIIGARHRRKVKEYRIMSHGGKGLENIDEEDWAEYINLKPYGVDDDYYVKQNEDAPTLEIAHTYGKRKIDRMTSVVRLSDPVIRDINCDELEKVGQLTDESLDILLEEVRKMEGRNYLAEKE